MKRFDYYLQIFAFTCLVLSALTIPSDQGVFAITHLFVGFFQVGLALIHLLLPQVFQMPRQNTLSYLGLVALYFILLIGIDWVFGSVHGDGFITALFFTWPISAYSIWNRNRSLFPAKRSGFLPNLSF